MVPNVPNDKKYWVRVMWFLNMRACLVANEILSLLENGYVDGAMARWRTLYEITTTAAFINNPKVKGNGNEISERYWKYQFVVGLNVTEMVKKAHLHPALSVEEIKKKKSNVDDLCKQFGSSFKGRNGWVADAFNAKDNPKFDISFLGIETMANRHKRKRILYKMASLNIHAGAAGDFSRLGAVPNIKGAMVVGASPFGLMIPICETASEFIFLARQLDKVYPSWQEKAIIALMEVLEINLINACKDANDKINSVVAIKGHDGH
jgi:hypothetical protein